MDLIVESERSSRLDEDNTSSFEGILLLIHMFIICM